MFLLSLPMAFLLWSTDSVIGKTVRRWNRATRLIRERIDMERRGKRVSDAPNVREE